ncbi:rod shape-determining protein RodA [Haloimpatiens lingqiaonensis]|uniref:rod shape-determining protein RodA n=1 Tax=Haloimpatiens lingqiaonensis TaxID=1380675 RepID=UPI0010FD3BCF|nr:rod shape-determining protein RodA [Haloimpatiens lingqiaonensis]
MLDKLKINKRLLKEIDFSVLIISIIIVVFGALNIFSATSGIKYFKLQLLWLLLGLAVVYIILTIDYNVIRNYSTLIYWAGVFLLILNDFVIGKVSKGAKSWIGIGSRAIQPSEFAKLGLILMLAKKIDDMEGKINEPKNFFTLVFYALVPMVLIVIQPDMGMTMVCFFIVLGIFFISGLDLKVIFGGLASLVVFIAIVWNSGIIHDYQQQRLTSFLHPEKDALGSNLQLTQSLIGIGSGGILGKGFRKGTQTALSFIPEAHTDFVFSVVGEEWGLVGALVLLTLYGVLIYRFIKIARTSKDWFGAIICVGVTSTFLFSLIQNIGMTIGIMPITGITLPLMSYGGSSILSSFMAIGLVLNVCMRRKKINF